MNFLLVEKTIQETIGNKNGSFLIHSLNKYSKTCDMPDTVLGSGNTIAGIKNACLIQLTFSWVKIDNKQETK